MSSSVPHAGHLSISFTTVELAVLATDLGYAPQRCGVRLPPEWTRRERELALGVARNSLRSRRVLVDEADGPAMAYAVAALLDVVCAPAMRVELYPGRDRPVRFLAQQDATVRVRERDGLHQLTPFATVDLLRWVAEDAGLHGQPAGPGDAVECDAVAYVAARRALSAGDLVAARAGLVGLGLPDVCVTALLRPDSTRALALRRRAGRVTVGGEIAWLNAGPDGLWLLPTLDQPLAGVDPVALTPQTGADPAAAYPPIPQPRDGAYAGAQAAETVRIAPVSGDALLATVAGFLRDEG